MKKGDEAKLNRIIKDIKSVKIQGAENVAKAGIKAFLIDPTQRNARKILSLRPTEPLLSNAIKILLLSKNKKGSALKFLDELKRSHELISKYGSNLVKGDMNVYSHCHSSTVIDILIEARKKKRRFVVYTTEVEPLLQGRMTARDLAKEGINVIVGPDLAMEQMLKKCDLILFGADAYTSKYVYNKIGTDVISRLAKLYKIPVYSCGVSMKITKKVKIEKRSGREVWFERNKNIKIFNPAFDKAHYKLLTGVISEFGVLRPKEFVKKAKEKLKEISRI